MTDTSYSDENNLSPEAFTLTAQEVDEIILELMKKYTPWIVVDINYFFDLLKHSLSLSLFEKKRVVDETPKLTQFQYDELTKVFEEERVKFRELSSEYPEDIQKLLKRQKDDWAKLWEIYKNEQLKEQVSTWEQQKIDDIKKSLGL